MELDALNKERGLHPQKEPASLNEFVNTADTMAATLNAVGGKWLLEIQMRNLSAGGENNNATSIRKQNPNYIKWKDRIDRIKQKTAETFKNDLIDYEKPLENSPQAFVENKCLCAAVFISKQITQLKACDLVHFYPGCSEDVLSNIISYIENERIKDKLLGITLHRIKSSVL